MEHEIEIDTAIVIGDIFDESDSIIKKYITNESLKEAIKRAISKQSNIAYIKLPAPLATTSPLYSKLIALLEADPAIDEAIFTKQKNDMQKNKPYLGEWQYYLDIRLNMAVFDKEQAQKAIQSQNRVGLISHFKKLIHEITKRGSQLEIENHSESADDILLVKFQESSKRLSELALKLINIDAQEFNKSIQTVIDLFSHHRVCRDKLRSDTNYIELVINEFTTFEKSQNSISADDKRKLRELFEITSNKIQILATKMTQESLSGSRLGVEILIERGARSHPGP